MKGVIFNVVEEVVVRVHGAETWERVLGEAQSDGVFTALGTYDDGVLVRIIDVVSDLLSVPPPEVLRLVGRHGYAHLAGRYPRLTERYSSSRALLAALDQVIHPQVLAVSPGARPPAFEATSQGDRLHLRYDSGRQLCHLAEGLAAGAVASFGETARVTQPTCELRGDDRCEIVVDYAAGG